GFPGQPSICSPKPGPPKRAMPEPALADRNARRVSIRYPPVSTIDYVFGMIRCRVPAGATALAHPVGARILQSAPTGNYLQRAAERVATRDGYAVAARPNQAEGGRNERRAVTAEGAGPDPRRSPRRYSRWRHGRRACR